MRVHGISATKPSKAFTFKTAPANIKPLPSTERNGWYEVTLYEGHNQQIRKMFDAVGHSVVKLRRTSIGPLTDQGLKIGQYRKLDRFEIEKLHLGNKVRKISEKG